MQEVARQSDGQYKLGPGTLYDNLQRLMNQGVVDEVSPRSADEDPRRRYYRLTAQGRGILSAEVTRLEGGVARSEAALADQQAEEGVMLRFLYRFLLCLHPRAFRQRFAEGMLWIFDETAQQGTGRLLT